MGRPVPTCADCTQKCLLIHGKDWGQSPIVTSFFKIMMRSDFSYMPLPTALDRFVPELKEHEYEQIEQSLEDSSGKRWTVTLSKSNAGWGFWQGWHAFSVDQGLEIGDFVTFHYIKGSGVFIVQIFGKHGFEKNQLSKKNRREPKRARRSSDFVAENSKKPSSGSDSRKKQASDTSALSGSNADPIISEHVVADKNSDTTGGVGREAQVQATPCEEELIYMVNRDKGHDQEDDRITFYDLSNFETPRSKDVDGDRILGNKGPSFVSSVRPRSNPMTKDVPKLVEKECFAALTSSPQPTSDITYSQEKTNKKLPNEDQSSKLVKKSTPMVQNNQTTQWKFVATQKTSFAESIKTQNFGFDGKLKNVKKEQMEINGDAFRPGKTMNGNTGPIIKEASQSRDSGIKDNVYPIPPNVVKPEPMDLDEEEELQSHDWAVKDDIKPLNWSVTLVVTSQAYLESRVRFPSASARGRPRAQRLLLLRDPTSRLWPVAYFEKFARILLLSGWSGFCKSNNVREGDECVFKVEDRVEGIYGVTIFRK